MSAYEALAGAYDGLTWDIPYEKILGFIEAVLQEAGKKPETVLDLACGTGSMSVLLGCRITHRILFANPCRGCACRSPWIWLCVCLTA